MNVVTLKRFTIDEYHRLIELGFLREEDRIELIRGELIQMTAKGTYWIINLNARQLERYSQRYQNAQGEFNYLSKQISLGNQSVAIPNFDDALLELRRIFRAG
jgi:Uma2 family endonuclease